MGYFVKDGGGENLVLMVLFSLNQLEIFKFKEIEVVMMSRENLAMKGNDRRFIHGHAAGLCSNFFKNLEELFFLKKALFPV